MNTLTIPEAGPVLTTERQIIDLIGQTFGQQIDLVIIPTTRLGPDFFSLRTGLAGTVAQKFANYRLRLAILGDITAHLTASEAFRDFVRETNRGTQLWFVSDQRELERKLSARPC
ncbi:MAG: DUF4180 domain-containing protein [Archangium sp.]|nr:DUF4180 domain-containing protein [Archangium sp.]